MPFKNHEKQLKYMRDYMNKRKCDAEAYRKLFKSFKAKQELTQTLTNEMIKIARNAPLKARHKFSIEAIPKGTFLSAVFNIESADSLRIATQTVCNAEDKLIAKAQDVYAIGVHEDFQVTLLNDLHGLVWEIIAPLNQR